MLSSTTVPFTEIRPSTGSEGSLVSLPTDGSLASVGSEPSVASVGSLVSVVSDASDASDVSVETSDSINIVNVISYDSTATPIGASLTLPVYYDDYSTPFTVVDNGSDTLTIFYDDSTDAIKNRLSLLENTFAIEDIIGVDLIINSSITIHTIFSHFKVIEITKFIKCAQ